MTEWKKGISDKEIEKTDKMIDDLIDMIDDNPNIVRLFALRSFGESLYHSVTDACLEDGYKAI